jgi:vanillate O-demethylase monooxygenase subunit
MNYLRNGWYAVALAPSVGREPIKRVLLGEPVALYRTEAGAVVALADRCPHRFAPLHKGKLKGDCLECPYHGLQFDTAGTCVFNPQGDHKIPQAARVKSYAVAERDGLVWVWAGEAGRADRALLPDFGEFFGNGAYTPVAGEFDLNANYELVMDNLLDLSHAPFLHPTSLADPASIRNLRMEMKQEGNSVWNYHWVPNAPPSAQFKPFRQSSEPMCDTHAHMRWDPPANLQLDVGVTELGRPKEEGLYLHFVHLLTPIDAHRTHYTWIAARNFLVGVDEVSRVMQEQINLAFQHEDEPMISAVAENMATSDLFALSPVMLASDGASVRARRILKQLIEREEATSSA